MFDEKLLKKAGISSIKINKILPPEKKSANIRHLLYFFYFVSKPGAQFLSIFYKKPPVDFFKPFKQ